MVIQQPHWMPYYAAMATLGSVAGCLVLYYLARKGGDAFIRRRVHGRTLDRATRLVRKYGVLTLLISAILPPPAPFKLFVLLAGVSDVRALPFAASIAVGRGLRYFGIGLLSVWYGQRAVAFLETHGAMVAVLVAVAAALGVAAWWLVRRYRRGEPALTSAG
jgi:membrane protein YqaA with SNARE-associated domain